MTEYFSPERALSVRLYVCVCVCVCVYVCVYVCVSVTAFYLKTIRPILMKLGPYDLIKNLRWHFFQIFDMLLRWRHSGHFVCFRMRHSHGRNFALIFFKITDKKVWRLPMFAIENQQNRLITSGRKSGPRFQKIAFFVFEPVSEVPGSIPGLGKKNFNLNFSSYDREWFLLCEKHRKWLNILLTLWCSCCCCDFEWFLSHEKS